MTEILKAQMAALRRFLRSGPKPRPSKTMIFRKISAEPLVIFSGTSADSLIGLPGLYRGRRLGTKGWHLISPTWTIDRAETARGMRRAALRHRLVYPGHRLVFVCNTDGETARMRGLGEAAVTSSGNSSIDPNIFRPLAGVERKFDAIYNAQLTPWKRHELTLATESCAFIYYRADMAGWLGQYEEMLLIRHRTRAPGHVFLNDFDFRRRPVRMPSKEVNRHLNAAHVGLCLSAVEGSMLSSLEYLLAGLPVVSTASLGGRDRFFDDDYCLIVEDTPQAVARGVAELKSRNLDPETIRARTIARMYQDRAVLRQLVNRIFEAEASDLRLAEDWTGTGPFSRLWRAANDVFRAAHDSSEPASAQPGGNGADARSAELPETTPGQEIPLAAERDEPAPVRASVAERPLISVLQMGYNQADMIEPSLRAVLAQTYSPLEVVFSDDCSQDGTFEIMQKVAAEYSGPHRIVLNRNPENLGLVGNLNRAVALSGGEILIQANGDDLSYPERAARVHDTWAEDPGTIKLIFCDMDRIDMEGRKIGLPRSTSVTRLDPSPEDLLRDNGYVVGSASAYHRDLFDCFGPLPDCAIVEDHVLPFRASILGRFAHVPEPLVAWRTGGISWVSDEERLHPDTVLFGHRLGLIGRLRANYLACLQDCATIDFPQRARCEALSRVKVSNYTYTLQAASADPLSLVAMTPLALAKSVLMADRHCMDAHFRYLFCGYGYRQALRSHRAGLRRRREWERLGEPAEAGVKGAGNGIA